MQQQPDWFELLKTALLTKFGIEIAVSDVEFAKQALYRARQGQAVLEGLQIRTSLDNPSGALWIVKGPKGNGAV